jgi:hypothetical protein
MFLVINPFFQSSITRITSSCRLFCGVKKKNRFSNEFFIGDNVKFNNYLNGMQITARESFPTTWLINWKTLYITVAIVHWQFI